MFNRRRLLQAAAGSLALVAPRLRAQPRPSVKVRYNEVARSILFAPAYVALAKGFFAEVGLDVTMTTANGGDKSMAALLSGVADIALMGPEAAIYVFTSDSPVKARIFCGLAATDGFLLVGRNKVDKFDWSMLKGKGILGYRPGSTPLLFFEAAMRQNGIDPIKDVRLVNNVGIPARIGSWLAGQNQFAIFIEPDCSQLELDGKAFYLASIGETVGFTENTSFMATDTYIRQHPDVLQNWTNAIYRAQRLTAAAAAPEIAATLAPYFPETPTPALLAAIERYQRLRIWKTTPIIEPPAIDKFEDILVEGHVLEPAKRVKFADLILHEFARKAI
jgi:NitT/TauT family transport system substrate-binding protein